MTLCGAIARAAVPESVELGATFDVLVGTFVGLAPDPRVVRRQSAAGRRIAAEPARMMRRAGGTGTAGRRAAAVDVPLPRRRAPPGILLAAGRGAAVDADRAARSALAACSRAWSRVGCSRQFSLSPRFFSHRHGDLGRLKPTNARCGRACRCTSCCSARSGARCCSSCRRRTSRMLWFGISATTLATAFLVGFSGECDRARSRVEVPRCCAASASRSRCSGILLLAPRLTRRSGCAPAHASSWRAIAQHAVHVSAPPLAAAGDRPS